MGVALVHVAQDEEAVGVALVVVVADAPSLVSSPPLRSPASLPLNIVAPAAAPPYGLGKAWVEKAKATSSLGAKTDSP